MIATAKELLGVGIYTPAEAALYARIHANTMSRWMYGAGGEPVVDPQVGNFEGERVVTFLDFVQAMAIRAIRLAAKVPLSKIREAYDTARKEHGVEYPFAQQHKIYLFGNLERPALCNVVIRIAGKETDDRLFQITGKKSGNQVIGPVFEDFAEDLVYTDGLATKYLAFRDPRSNGTIQIDPAIRFGEPVVMSCGYTAQTLYDAYKAEGCVEAASQVYGVPENDIEIACRYFNYLTGASAA